MKTCINQMMIRVSKRNWARTPRLLQRCCYCL